MRREHELYREAVKNLLNVVRGGAERLELRDPSRQRFTERLGMLLPLPVVQYTDPLPVLGDVDQVEEDAERSGHDRRLPLVERFDPGREGRLGVVPAEAAVAAQRSDLLHEIDCLLAGDLTDHRAEHVTEKTHIAVEQFVVGHGGGSGGGKAG